MANTVRVNGLSPVMHLNGSAWNGQMRKYVIPVGNAVATFVGDLVTADGTGDVDGYQTVVQAAAGGASIGVVVGFEVLPGTQGINLPQFRVASTRRVVYVADSPDTVFEIQENAGTPLGVASIGLNANVIVGAGSTTTGASGMEIDTTTEATTATLQLKILQAVQRVDNDPALTRARWLVTINNHQLGSSTGTAGV